MVSFGLPWHDCEPPVSHFGVTPRRDRVLTATSLTPMPRLVLSADVTSHHISRHLYGHFAEHLGRCVYEGLYVGEDSPIPNTRGFRNDVVGALRKLDMPNLRWPGGCFADTYHWRDGVGPKPQRPEMVNVHWGGVTENNHCGTHEFLDLCAQLSTDKHPCEPYIAGNLGSGTVREMAEWLEYITMPGKSPMADLRRRNGRELPWDLTYWGVGNENWGCGGNMRAEYYADEYRRYASYCRHMTPGKKLYKVACGLTDDWNDVLMRIAGPHMEGLSVHYYTLPGSWEKKGPSTGFSTEDWFVTLKKAYGIEDFIRKTAGIMDRHDPKKRVGMIMDEWGTWYDVEPGTNPGFLYQQNTLRDALVAGLTFNVFHDWADRVHMANIAQTINVLQAMILTEGPAMVLTPTYHVFEMYKVHQDATRLSTHVEAGDYSLDGKDKIPHVTATASKDAAGKVHLSLVNFSHEAAIDLPCDLRGASFSKAKGRIITADKLDTHNSFEAPTAITPRDYSEFTLKGSTLTLKVPAKSVLSLELT